MKTQSTHPAAGRSSKGALGAILFLGLIFLAMPTQNAHAFGIVHHRHHRHHSHHGHHGSVGLIVGAPTTTYVSGYWSYRTERVLVEPARQEKVWVEPVFKEIVDSDGKILKVKISEGYWKTVYVPARYETRTVRYWVPGYYAGSPARSSVSFGIGFGF